MSIIRSLASSEVTHAQGRPLRTTNQDGTYKEASYSGCGCAGGEVVTLQGEEVPINGQWKRRTQKVYSDVLGRKWKTEVLNWDGSAYSATTNTFNARDQVTLVRQFAGTDQSQTYQDTTMSYDGYGRLQSKHVPEQNAGTATVYAYNSDDTIQSVTDARGASASYVYNNNRHLVNEINYSAPAGITPTSNITFGYDAAGNRTSMMDGTGGTIYVYDQLSRMTSETHTITGLGANTINYQYNLAGQLTSITDPLNVTINYGRDQAGRLSGVAGSGDSAVPTFASNMQYRAWGAVKHLNYGNGRMLDATYNSRLQAASFQIPGVISKTYEYHADNRLRFSSDQLDHRFDRFYSYDHAARIKEASSGAEARFEAPTDDRPYRQTYAYDALNHLTARTSKVWLVNMSSSDSYTNNRHDPVGSLWQYDADGNLLMMPGTGYTRDAAGRVVTITTATPTILSLDGDGRQVKSAETVYDPETETESTTTTYYVRSTVLGGEVLTEIDPENNHTRTFVYAGGVVLATQESWGIPFVSWEHRDPSNATYRTTMVGTQPGDHAELDPVGSNAGISNGASQSIPEEGSLAPYPSFGSPSQLGTTYSWDGILMPADELLQMVNQLMHGSFGLSESLARQSSQPVEFRRSGVSSGRRFDVTYGSNGRILSSWRGDYDELAHLAGDYANISAVYSSGLWGQLGALLTDGTRAALSPKQQELFDRERGRLLSLLKDKNSPCAKFLMEKFGLSSTRVAKAADAIRPFDGPTSTVTMGDAGLLPRRHPKTGRPVLDSYDLVGIHFDRRKETLRAASALYATPDDRGATLRDIYFSSSFDATTILHETLHTFTGMRDEDLAAKLGVKLIGDDTSPISDALRAGGCR